MMKRLFAGLGGWAGLFLLTTMGLGFSVKGAGDTMSWHIKAGLLTAVLFLLLHCTIFIHLLGTGLGVKRAVFEHRLEEGVMVRRLWALKMRAFPPAFGCMALIIMLGVSGGAVQQGGIDPSLHRWLAIAVLVANIVTIPIEVGVIAHNEQLMREVEEAIAAREASAGAAPATRGAP